MVPKAVLMRSGLVSLTTARPDGAVNEKMADSLERAATTATSLDAEQDSGVNTPRSDEDSLKLKELMELCTNLQNRVIDLEKTKTSQALEIDSLKRKVKKLEKKQRSRTHKLKRLYKVRLTTRVDSSADEASLGEDASKQGRKINDIDADEGITLVDETTENQGRFDDQEDAEMLFDVADDLRGEEVFISQEVPLTEVNATVATTTTTTIDDITLAKAHLEINSAKPKVDKVVIQESEHAKRAEEKRNTPPTRAQQRSIISKRAGEELEQKNAKKQKMKDDKESAELKQCLEIISDDGDDNAKKQKMKDDKESAELKQCLEIISDDGDDVTIDATPLSSKSPTIVDYKIHKGGKKSYFQIFKVDARFEKIKLVDYMDNLLLHSLKTMFEHHVIDNSIPFYLLVEKMYPLTNHTLHQMFNDVKLQVDYECGMAFKLLRLVKK
nr:hypothetical protein [Tanacetum cinerariifolium]